MAQLSLAVLVGLIVAGEAVGFSPFNLGGLGGLSGLGGLGSFHQGGHGIGYGVGPSHHGGGQHEKERNLRLTCQGGTPINGIGLTIDDKSNRRGYGGYGSPFDHLFGKGQESGLNATLQVRTDLGLIDPVTIIITEKGFVPPGLPGMCDRENFGVGVSPSKKKNAGFGLNHGLGLALGNSYGFGAGGGAGGGPGAYGLGNYGVGASAYGAIGAAGYGNLGNVGNIGYGNNYGGVGYSPLGALPYGFAHPHDFNRNDGYGSREHIDTPGDGAIASFSLGLGTLETIRLDSLGKFKKLSDLAGRGVIVCTEATKGFKGKAQCTGLIVTCCTLGYDNMMRGVFQP